MIYALGDRAPEFEGAGHFVADNASIIGSVRLGDRASVWFNCVLRGDNDWLVVGERSNIPPSGAACRIAWAESRC